MDEKMPNLTRRTFVKAAGALGALAAASGTLAATESAFGEVEPAPEGEPEKIVWSQCNVNCGGRCVFKWHVKDGKVLYMETDDTGEEGLSTCLLAWPFYASVVEPPRSFAISDEARGQTR